jgi:hypothetical protein
MTMVEESNCRLPDDGQGLRRYSIVVVNPSDARIKDFGSPNGRPERSDRPAVEPYQKTIASVCPVNRCWWGGVRMSLRLVAL